jgi:hypothetical protein
MWFKRIMTNLISSQVPAPALVGGTNETLVADGVQRRVCGRYPDHGVRASLSCWPYHFPTVEPTGVPHSPSNAVCALGNGVPVER